MIKVEFNDLLVVLNFIYTDSKKDMPSMTPGLERDMPRVTPRLENGMSSMTPRTNGGNSVPLVAGLTAESAAIAVLIILLLVIVTHTF